MAQVCFYLIQLKPETSCISKRDLENFCKRIAHLSEVYVGDFFKITKHDVKAEITIEEFIAYFPDIKHSRFLTLIPNLVKGASSMDMVEYP